MVKMMSQTVENRLILNLFRGEHFQLTFNTGLSNLDSQWAGLLIFDESGQVLSANRRADNLLGISLSRVMIDSLFKVSLLELLNQPEGLPFALQAAGRNRFQCLLKRPKQMPVQARVFSQPPPPAPTSINLQTLHFGDVRVEKPCARPSACWKRHSVVDSRRDRRGQRGVRQSPAPGQFPQPPGVDRGELCGDSCRTGGIGTVRLRKGAFTGANQKAASA